MGRWMKINGESIYGTHASPFESLPWGRCTQKSLAENTRLYLHVFDWPQTGELTVPGIFNEPIQAYLLADSTKTALSVVRKIDALAISVPVAAPDSFNSVVVLDIHSRPEIAATPKIEAAFDEFIDQIEINITPLKAGFSLRYTLDGSDPTIDSPVAQIPVRLTETTKVTARSFRDGKAVSPASQKIFTKVTPRTAKSLENLQPGLEFGYFEGTWKVLPNFKILEALKHGITPQFNLAPRLQDENFGMQFTGFIQIPEDGMYAFYTDSDDGSQLFIDEQLIVENDGLHGLKEIEGAIALAAGLHPIRVIFFQGSGGADLVVRWRSTGFEKQVIPESVLWH